MITELFQFAMDSVVGSLTVVLIICMTAVGVVNTTIAGTNYIVDKYNKAKEWINGN